MNHAVADDCRRHVLVRKPAGPCIYACLDACVCDREPRCPNWCGGVCSKGGITEYCGVYVPPKWTRVGP